MNGRKIVDNCHGFNGKTKYLCYENDTISITLEAYRHWESPIISKALDYLKDDSVILDIGANIGVWTVNLAKAKRQIHSFEPFKPSYLALCGNVFLNGVDKNVTVYNCAITDDNTKKLMLKLDEDINIGGMRVVTEEEIENKTVIQLDTIIDENQEKEKNSEIDNVKNTILKQDKKIDSDDDSSDDEYDELMNVNSITNNIIDINSSINSDNNNILNVDVKIEDYVVELKTIDSLNLSKLDFIKIDVEGHEYEALKGGENTIKKFKPVIFFECWVRESFKEKKDKLFEYIESLGYEITSLSHNGHYLDDFQAVPI
jgi:FkbM family methyltransferase